MTSLPRYIDRGVSSYLKAQIESGDPVRTKRALQEISRLYRSGGRCLQDQLIGIELAILGLIVSSNDTKVRRWALNTLAQLGREASCKPAILHALQAYHADAEVLAAAIAALYRLCRTASGELRKMGFDEQTVTLAAMQHVPADKLDLSCLPLRVDRADAELLKLGLIVVGLDRAPPNMFEPGHDNAAIVRALGGHQDPIVSQYAVWAVTENSSLNIAHLGIDLKSIEQRPPNVRGWVFQLLAIDAATTNAHIDYIKLGIEDGFAEARLGLAIGLKNTFCASLVPLVLEWFLREMDGEISAQILDHLIRQSDHSEAYRQHAIDAFERGNADARDRMLATAAGSSLFSSFSAIKYNGSGSDLFRGATFVQNNKTINIGTAQAGAMAFDGDAHQSGAANITYNGQTLEIIQSRLVEAEREIRNSVADTATKKEALEAVEAAKKDPNKDNLGRVVTVMGKVEALAQKTLGAGTAIAEIAKHIARASGLG